MGHVAVSKTILKVCNKKARLAWTMKYLQWITKDLKRGLKDK